MSNIYRYDGGEHVYPAELAHDEDKLDLAEAEHKAALAAGEETARALDVAEGIARRGGGDRTALHMAELAEQGARRRIERSTRDVEERRTAAIMDWAVNELPKLEARIHVAEDQLGAAADEWIAGVLDLNRNRAGVDHDLRAATDDVAIRLRMTGRADQYDRLPRAVPDPFGRLAALVEAARRRAENR